MDVKDKLLQQYKEYVSSRSIYKNYIEEYDTFASSILKDTRGILIDHNTAFQWERKGNTRDGALTQKNLKEKIGEVHLLLKVIKIRRDTEFISQIHVYFHELTHLVCNHNDQGYNETSLTTAQKEYVAEVTAQALLHSFVGGLSIEDIPFNGKWEASKYVSSWLKQGKFTESKGIEMWEQIEYAYNLITDHIKEKTQV